MKLIYLILFSIFIDLAMFKKNEISSKFGDEDYDINDLDEEELKRFQKMQKIDFDTFEMKSQIINEASMVVKITGSYTLFSKETIIWLFNSEGKALLSIEEKGKIYLLNNDIIYAKFIYYGEASVFRIEIKYLNQKYNLPFDPINIIDESKFDKSSIPYDPLKPAEVKYKKREGNFLYINSNNPEIIEEIDLNKALIRLDISNKEVFFTFEHNTYKIKSKIFCVFQIRNTGTKNLKVTIKNIGFQYDGLGKFLGQKEWIDFYNMKFKLKNKDKWTEKQRERFKKIINFSDDYTPTYFPTRTFSIPAGEYFYVIGGTSQDSYNNYNIFNTADIDVKDTVVNGVVLFEVSGEAQGAFYFYNDINIPKTDTTSYQGYVSQRETNKNVGAQYIGYDNCNGVVDNSMTWEFNDLTQKQYLPVFYKVNFSDTAPMQDQIPYSKVPTQEHIINAQNWITHLNPHKFVSKTTEEKSNNKRPVGNDMTKFITINDKGEEIIIDNEHYDGRGILANIGNWMIDYIDNFNFVNRGDKKRKISVLIGHGYQGSLACFVRNAKLEIIEGTEQNTVYFPDSNSSIPSNDAIKDIFNYTFIIEPHSVTQIYVEYNLLPHSYGTVTHSVYLSEAIDEVNSGFLISNKVTHLFLFLILLLII